MMLFEKISCVVGTIILLPDNEGDAHERLVMSLVYVPLAALFACIVWI